MGFLKWLRASRPVTAPAPAKQPLYVSYSTETSRKYEVTPDEERFFSALSVALRQAKKSEFFNLTRMANGAISVRSRRGYLGKIKLQGRKTWMQYMTGLYNAEVAENLPLEEYIKLLKYWVRTA